MSDHALHLVLMCPGLQCIGSSFDSLLCTPSIQLHRPIAVTFGIRPCATVAVMIFLHNQVLQTTGHTARTRQSLQKSVQQRSHKPPSCDIPNFLIILFYKQQSLTIPCLTIVYLLFWIYRLFLAYIHRNMFIPLHLITRGIHKDKI